MTTIRFSLLYDCVVTARASPRQNAYCERAIGTLRREYLDHVIAINQIQVEHVLDEYVR